MSDDDDGEIGGDSAICDKIGERGGVVKGDKGCEVRGDDGGNDSQGGGFTLFDLVRGASVGVCGSCNSEGQLPVVYFIVEVRSGSLKVQCYHNECLQAVSRGRFKGKQIVHDGSLKCSRWS